jgi:hypothetical protein
MKDIYELKFKSKHHSLVVTENKKLRDQFLLQGTLQSKWTP